MNILLDQSVHFSITTHHPVSGFAFNADISPVFYVFEENSDTHIVTGSLTQRTGFLGVYRGTFNTTLANGFDVNKWYNVVVSGIVQGVQSFHAPMNFYLGSGNTGSLTASEVWNHGTRTLTSTVDANLITWRGNTPQHLEGAGFVRSSGVNEYPAGASLTASDVWNHATRSLTVPVSTSGGLIDTTTNITNTINTNLVTWKGSTPLDLNSDGRVQTSGFANVLVMRPNTVDASQFTQAAADKVWNTSTKDVTSVLNTVNANVTSWMGTSPATLASNGYVKSSGLNEYQSGLLTANDVWNHATRSLTVPVSTSGGLVDATTSVTNTINANLLTWKGSTPLDLLTGGFVQTSGFANILLWRGLQPQTLEGAGFIRSSGVNEYPAGASLTAADVWTYVTRSLTTPVSTSGGLIDVATSVTNTVNANLLTWKGVTPLDLLTGGFVQTSGFANLLLWRGLTPLQLEGVGYLRTSGVNEYPTVSTLTASDVWNHATRSLTVPVSTSGGLINTTTNVTNNVNANVSQWLGVTPLALENGYVRTSGLNEYPSNLLTAAQVWTYGTRSLTTPVSTSGGLIDTTIGVTNTINSNVLTWKGATPLDLNPDGRVQSSGFSNVLVIQPNVITSSQFTQNAADKIWLTSTRNLTTPVSVSGGLVDLTTSVNNTVNSNLLTWKGVTPLDLLTGGFVQSSGFANVLLWKNLQPLSLEGAGYIRSSGINEYPTTTALTASDVWNHANRSLTVPVSVSGLVQLDTSTQVKIDNLDTRLTTTRANYLDNLNVGGLVAPSAQLEVVLSRLTNTRATNLDNLDTTISSRATNADVWNNPIRTLTAPVSTSGGLLDLVTSVTNNINANLVTWKGVAPLDLIGIGYVRTSGINEYFTSVTPSDIWNYGTRQLTHGVIVSGLLDDVITETSLKHTAINEIGTNIWGSGIRTLTTPVSVSGTVLLGAVTHTGAIIPTVNNITNGVTLSTDIYFADIQFTRDQSNTKDEYTVSWFKNGVPVTAGISNAQLQLVKRSDGTDLLSATNMSEIGSIGVFKLDTTGTNRLTVGEAVIAIATSLIDSSTRTQRKIIGRDSS